MLIINLEKLVSIIDKESCTVSHHEFSSAREVTHSRQRLMKDHEKGLRRVKKSGEITTIPSDLTYREENYKQTYLKLS